MKRKTHYFLMCYIQNKGKRKENVHCVHVQYREVFGLVTSDLLVLIIGFMEHNTELYAEYITS